ncbi:hypothetical protein KTT_40860 [Tengunoibacter tsumagoiensis]|uniref:Uncharacterized protein n=1 Tax=Tengunoibacter tsumagoiensis TaxID=2014871 RepID=A0A402A4Z6_9CHLR|nr:hypothetical protein KTT_40320 [Tengunoibacter tsumagoiensis]GCE14227.1 hypothetical protein KTT_40860 [Tengunoibacter tsumagoiensis]
MSRKDILLSIRDGLLFGAGLGLLVILGMALLAWMVLTIVGMVA